MIFRYRLRNSDIFQFPKFLFTVFTKCLTFSRIPIYLSMLLYNSFTGFMSNLSIVSWCKYPVLCILCTHTSIEYLHLSIVGIDVRRMKIIGIHEAVGVKSPDRRHTKSETAVKLYSHFSWTIRSDIDCVICTCRLCTSRSKCPIVFLVPWADRPVCD